MTSTRSSAVTPACRIATSPLLILYSLSTALISSWSMFVKGTVFVIATPPLSFLRTVMFGGFLFSRMPKPSSSDSMSFLSPRGFRTSRTMKMRWHVLATVKVRAAQYSPDRGSTAHVPAMTRRVGQRNNRRLMQRKRLTLTTSTTPVIRTLNDTSCRNVSLCRPRRHSGRIRRSRI